MKRHRQNPGTTLDVSVVFGRNDRDIERCLETLFEHCPDDVEMSVTVVANQGRSVLVDRLERTYPEARIIVNQEPAGFAANHNRVLSETRADYVLVINDDLVFGEGSITGALAFMDRPENRDVGVLGPRLLNPDGSLQPSTYRFPTIRRALIAVSGLRSLLPFNRPLNWLAGLLGRGGGRSRYWAHDRTVDVDTFRGAYMLARGDAVREVGTMQEITRVGVEEVEWHRRMWDTGWRVVFHPGVEVVHLGSRTIKLRPELRHEHLRGFLAFFRKHRSSRAYRTFGFLAAITLWARSAWNAARGEREEARLCREGAREAWRAFRQPGESGVPGD